MASSSSSSSSDLPVICRGRKLTMLNRALRGDVNTLQTVIKTAVNQGRPFLTTFLWRDDSGKVQLDHIVEIQMIGQWLSLLPQISIGDLYRIYRLVNSDFNLCWVSARTNQVKKLLISVVMTAGEVSTGDCNIVDAFDLFNPESNEDYFAAFIPFYGITDVEFKRVTTYLGSRMIYMQKFATAMEGLIAHSRAAEEPELSTLGVVELVRCVKNWTSGSWETSQIDASQMPSNDQLGDVQYDTDIESEPEIESED